MPISFNLHRVFAALLVATTLGIPAPLFADSTSTAADCLANPDSCDQRLNNAAASSSANLEYEFETLLLNDWGLRKNEASLARQYQKASKFFEASQIEDFVGNWSGAYVCGQGKTGMSLHLEHRPDKTVQGVFRFFPLSTEHTNVKKGAFEVQVLATKELIFVMPGNWLEQPENYVTVGMVGKLQNDGQAFVGEIQLPMCGNFALLKPKQ